MTVHSKQLGTASALGTALTTIYTCPTNKRTIVKSLVVYNGAAGANVVTWELKAGSTLLATWNTHLAATGAAGDTVYEAPWIVMNAADLLQAIASASGVRLVVSGAELSTI